MVLRLFIGALSPAGSRAKLSILIFHRVRPAPDPLFPGDPDVPRFREQMRWVSSWFHVLPLTEAIERFRQGTLPARAAAITFDDGYADNYTLAWPVLRDLGLTATCFVASGFLDGGRMWNDTVIEAIRTTNRPSLNAPDLGLDRLPLDSIEAKRSAIRQVLGQLKYRAHAEREGRAVALATDLRASLPADLMLTSAQVGEMNRAGMTIGAHTVSHPILANLTLDDARTEIVESKRRLEELTGNEVTLFAYPNGRPGKDYTGRDAELVKAAGFAAAVSTSPGAAGAGADLFQLPRFTPWDRSPWKYGARLAKNLRQPSAAASAGEY